MKFSLRWKMLVLIFILTAIPILSLGIADYLAAVSSLTDSVKDIARSNLEGTGEVADLFLKSVEEAVTMMSKNATVQNSASDFGAVNRMVEIFGAYQQAHVDILNVFMATKYRAYIVEPRIDLPQGFDPTARPWYPVAMAASGIIWTEPYIEEGTGRLVVSAARAVYKPNEAEAIGVTGADVALDSLAQLISAKPVGQEGYLVLLDKKGYVLAHPDPNQLGKLFDSPDVVKALLSNVSGELDYTEAGDERYATYSTIQRTGWKLVALISYDEASVHMQEQLRRSLIMVLLFLFIALAVGVAFCNYFLLKPVSNLVKGAEEIARGNFRAKLETGRGDELGLLAQAFITLQQNLGKLIGEVKVASDTTAQLSQTVFRSSQEISASTEETAATTNEFAGSVQQMSDRVQRIDSDGSAIRQVAENGEGLVSAAMNQMQAIEKSFDGLHKSVDKLGAQSRQIGQITDIIRGIADQTNLLALNAAIEAARAGDQGRGFAVVADEVRGLAEQSGKATEQIAALVKDINSQIAQVMGETNNSIEEVKAGSNSVQVAGETFGEIGKAINGISVRIQEVAAYALQLSVGSEEMAASTEEQAATLQEITKSANDLAKQAGVLMELTEGFQI